MLEVGEVQNSCNRLYTSMSLPHQSRANKNIYKRVQM